MTSAFGVEHGAIGKADRRQRGAAIAGAGAVTAGVGEYASANYNMRHGGHSGLKNLGAEDIGTHRDYIKTPNDPHWHSHNLNLGRAEGSVMEEKRALKHLTRGVAGSNVARLAGYGALATGAAMVAAGNRRRRKVSKADNRDLSPAALQGAGATAAAGGLGLRQFYGHKAKVEDARAAGADRMHAKTASMHRMTDSAKQRRYGFHEGRARQARHFAQVYRSSAKTGTGIAIAGGGMLGLAAYGQHMQNVGRHQPKTRVAKSAFGIDHGGLSKVAYTPYQPVDDVHGPVRNPAKAAEWRRQGLKVTERTDKGGNTSYARVGWYANKTVRRGPLRRKTTAVDLDNVRYERSGS